MHVREKAHTESLAVAQHELSGADVLRERVAELEAELMRRDAAVCDTEEVHYSRVLGGVSASLPHEMMEHLKSIAKPSPSTCPFPSPPPSSTN